MIRKLVVSVALVAVGCTSYYKVTDSTSGRVYYSADVKQERGGSTQLTDAKSGATPSSPTEAT